MVYKDKKTELLKNSAVYIQGGYIQNWFSGL